MPVAENGWERSSGDGILAQTLSTLESIDRILPFGDILLPMGLGGLIETNVARPLVIEDQMVI